MKTNTPNAWDQAKARADKAFAAINTTDVTILTHNELLTYELTLITFGYKKTFGHYSDCGYDRAVYEASYTAPATSAWDRAIVQERPDGRYEVWSIQRGTIKIKNTVKVDCGDWTENE